MLCASALSLRDTDAVGYSSSHFGGHSQVDDSVDNDWTDHEPEVLFLQTD